MRYFADTTNTGSIVNIMFLPFGDKQYAAVIYVHRINKDSFNNKQGLESNLQVVIRG